MFVEHPGQVAAVHLDVAAGELGRQSEDLPAVLVHAARRAAVGLDMLQFAEHAHPRGGGVAAEAGPVGPADVQPVRPASVGAGGHRRPFCLVCLDRSVTAMHRHWQLHEAEQRFSELIRSVEVAGPQFVTRHGEEVPVVVSLAEYRHLRNEGEDFKTFLQSAPDVDLEISRPASPARVVSLDEGE